LNPLQDKVDFFEEHSGNLRQQISARSILNTIAHFIVFKKQIAQNR